MNRFSSIAKSATPDDAHYFHPQPYGKVRAAEFLRDVLALANSPADGPRYLVVGMQVSADGAREIVGLPDDDGNSPDFPALIAEYIEPILRVQHETVALDDKLVSVFEIDGCHDQPYMLRADHCRNIRRGDAYALLAGKPVKLGRSQLQAMFEAHFKDAVSAERVEIGFPGDIIHKDLRLPVLNLDDLPSAQAATKLKSVVDILANSKGTGSTSVMARLTHARLFGPDSPYQEKSAPELLDEMKEVAKTYSEHDRHFLFETAAERVQIVVLNQGSEPLKNASLTLVLPRHEEFFVADELPRLLQDGEFVERGIFEADGYPRVTVRDNAVHVSVAVGDIAAGSQVSIFDSPLRIAAGGSLAGRRIGMRYSLSASNLRLPATGKLRLLFRGDGARAASVTPLRHGNGRVTAEK